VPLPGDGPAKRERAETLIVRARADRVELTRDDGQLTVMVRQVLHIALVAPVAAMIVVGAVASSPARGSVSIQTWQAAITPAGGEAIGSNSSEAVHRRRRRRHPAMSPTTPMGPPVRHRDGTTAFVDRGY
jgi:hypothetical protein